ncbi:MAG TPA: DUF5655 domain-containing protein [Candidatus Dojkabacteria bacterium]|nr:DUF5655 domain-containing protein [Candidatus Dojkabacteria bacterium]
MWKCDKCCRSFAKNNQSHSCRTSTLDEHFQNKEDQRDLFNSYIDFVRENVGDFKIEAVSCCIHLVNTFTFSAVWILKDKIRIDFASPEKLSNTRIFKTEQPSANRYVHYLDIETKDNLNEELINWLKQAYYLKS